MENVFIKKMTSAMISHFTSLAIVQYGHVLFEKMTTRLAAMTSRTNSAAGLDMLTAALLVENKAPMVLLGLNRKGRKSDCKNFTRTNGILLYRGKQTGTLKNADITLLLNYVDVGRAVIFLRTAHILFDCPEPLAPASERIRRFARDSLTSSIRY